MLDENSIPWALKKALDGAFEAGEVREVDGRDDVVYFGETGAYQLASHAEALAMVEHLAAIGDSLGLLHGSAECANCARVRETLECLAGLRKRYPETPQ